MIAGPGDAVPAAGQVRGEQFGRYLLLDQLGVGGMGVVLSAYDPELHRRVAIKLLRPDALGEGSKRLEHTVRLDKDGRPRDLIREQILAEGRAMASLSHPNLVAVYEVGEVGEQVFLAMEQVDGIRLSSWFEAKKRSWRDIVAVFVHAGRALAAAHAAGLVHGDFKPDNVLVEESGRVRVLDFGLARAAGTHARDRLVGTPAYMAPEQFARHPADARSDQFAFCVALYEALYRMRPFAGSSEREIAAAVATGDVRRPARRRGPRWLERALRTGLSPDAADRFSSMDELLSVLERRPQTTRRRIILAAAGVLALGLTAVGFVAGHESDEDRCTGGQPELDQVWDRGAAARVRASFVASGRAHAASSAGRVIERLDAYAGGWSAMHRSACRATARGEQSPELLDRRMACLDRELGGLRALVDGFVGRADGALVDRAIEMTGQLDSPSRCADSAAFLGQTPLPARPALRARVAELEGRIDRAEVERQAGRPQAALDQARAVEASLRGIDYPPLAARAASVIGRSLEDLGQPADAREALLRSIRFATRAGDERLAARNLTHLVGLVADREQRLPEAALIGQLAEAALERSVLRGDEDLRASLLAVLGVVSYNEGHQDRAVKLQREVLAIRRRTLPGDHPEVAVAESRLGLSLARKADHDEARIHLQEALAIRRRVFGDRHPLTAIGHINFSMLNIEEERSVEARRHLLAALSVLESMPEHRSYPIVLMNLGLVESDLGDLAAARRYLEACLAVQERKLGPKHPEVATVLQNLANVLRQSDRLEEAHQLRSRALAILEAAEAEHPLYATTLASFGEDLRRLGRPQESLPYQARAQKLIRSRLGDEHPRLGTPLAFEGLALFDLGQHRSAVPLLERALELFEPTDSDRARPALALAQALDPEGPRSPRTAALALEALVTFTSHGDERNRERAAEYLGRLARR